MRWASSFQKQSGARGQAVQDTRRSTSASSNCSNPTCAAGLAESTIHKHLDNVDFYLNVYLLHYDANEMEYGCHDIDGFLGDFLIRKCMWSTSGTIKTNATSIKKFYKCMRDNGLVNAAAYDELVRTVKENMTDWQADCAAFNDPASYDNLYFDDYPSGESGGEGGADNAVDGLSALSAMFTDDPELEGCFKEALKSILQERLVELFGDKLDEAAVTAYTAAAHTRLTSVRSVLPTREQVTDMFTLALFYLTSWEEKVGGKSGIKLRKAWKSADWGALDRLRESGFVDCTNKAKSVIVTVDGAAEAELFFRVLDLGHLVNG